MTIEDDVRSALPYKRLADIAVQFVRRMDPDDAAWLATMTVTGEFTITRDGDAWRLFWADGTGIVVPHHLLTKDSLNEPTFTDITVPDDARELFPPSDPQGRNHQ